jgi:DNA-binding Lrp family transcriptional regulator
MNNTVTRKITEINVGYFKNLELEIREMDFDGIPLQEIADRVGLSVPQVLEILDQVDDDDLVEYAENAADLDSDFYGRI